METVEVVVAVSRGAIWFFDPDRLTSPTDVSLYSREGRNTKASSGCFTDYVTYRQLPSS